MRALSQVLLLLAALAAGCAEKGHHDAVADARNETGDASHDFPDDGGSVLQDAGGVTVGQDGGQASPGDGGAPREDGGTIDAGTTRPDSGPATGDDAGGPTSDGGGRSADSGSGTSDGGFEGDAGIFALLDASCSIPAPDDGGPFASKTLDFPGTVGLSDAGLSGEFTLALFDDSMLTPIELATVSVVTNNAIATNTTNAWGVVSFCSSELAGDVTISVVRPGYNAVTLAHVNAASANVLLHLVGAPGPFAQTYLIEGTIGGVPALLGTPVVSLSAAFSPADLWIWFDEGERPYTVFVAPSAGQNFDLSVYDSLPDVYWTAGTVGLGTSCQAASWTDYSLGPPSGAMASGEYTYVTTSFSESFGSTCQTTLETTPFAPSVTAYLGFYSSTNDRVLFGPPLQPQSSATLEGVAPALTADLNEYWMLIQGVTTQCSDVCSSDGDCMPGLPSFLSVRRGIMGNDLSQVSVSGLPATAPSLMAMDGCTGCFKYSLPLTAGLVVAELVPSSRQSPGWSFVDLAPDGSFAIPQGVLKSGLSGSYTLHLSALTLTAAGQAALSSNDISTALDQVSDFVSAEVAISF